MNARICAPATDRDLASGFSKGEQSLNRAKSEETLVEGRSDTDVCLCLCLSVFFFRFFFCTCVFLVVCLCERSVGVQRCVCVSEGLFLELATFCSGPVLKLDTGTIKWLLSVNLLRK